MSTHPRSSRSYAFSVMKPTEWDRISLLINQMRYELLDNKDTPAPSIIMRKTSRWAWESPPSNTGPQNWRILPAIWAT